MNAKGGNTGSGTAIILTLAAIAALGSLATQLVVPALPPIAAEFGASTVAAQRVIGIYLLGLAGGQLFAGPMADKYGRRPVMLGGLGLFVIGSAAALAVHSLPWLLSARLLQALGGAAGIVTARVMVSDIFPPEEAATRQATLMSVVLLSPAIAPVIGGAMTEVAGWRSIFVLLVLTGLGAALFVKVRLAESPRRAAAPARNLLHAWGMLLATPRFTGNSLAMTLASSSLYAFLAATPFILSSQHGIGPRDTGLFLLGIAAAGIVGTKFVGVINRRSNGSIVGASLVASGAMLLLVGAVAGAHSLAAFFLPMVLMGFGTGVLGPSTISAIMQSRPGLEGTATSLAGALQMGGSALASSMIGAADTLRLGIVLSIMTLLSLAAAMAASRTRMQTA
ncbi:multidrug effflux MFS transporter [Novosphingobium aquae]|uniref:Bcr/CflA family efflux transporter n=1 Tax=Novosphingobium aquae TaxID=3133435 RepID=A0ABU8S4H7_9SPHN